MLEDDHVVLQQAVSAPAHVDVDIGIVLVQIVECHAVDGNRSGRHQPTVHARPAQGGVREKNQNSVFFFILTELQTNSLSGGFRRCRDHVADGMTAIWNEPPPPAVPRLTES